jgi:hypothetical protein
MRSSRRVRLLKGHYVRGATTRRGLGIYAQVSRDEIKALLGINPPSSNCRNGVTRGPYEAQLSQEADQRSLCRSSQLLKQIHSLVNGGRNVRHGWFRAHQRHERFDNACKDILDPALT